MKDNNRAYDFITNGNKTYQFKDGKLLWVIKW